jgi:hypothetical protein
LEASGSAINRLIQEGHAVETSAPRAPCKTPCTQPTSGRKLCHAWIDGSFREVAGFGRNITGDDKGEGPSIAEGLRNIGSQQTAIGAELAAIEQAISWFLGPDREWQHMTIRSDLTSVISRVGHTEAGPGKAIARNTRRMVYGLRGGTVYLELVESQEGTPGDERADVLGGKAAGRPGSLRSCR